MKRKLAAMFLAAGAALGAWADTETVGGIVWNYTVSGGKAQVGIGGYNGTRAVSTSTTGAIAIPSTLGGHPVTSVKEYAFDGCSGLTSVTIPDGVTSIERDAFRGCDALFDTTTIPGVKLVGGWAVGYTSSLPGPLDLTGVRGIGENAFRNCSGLTSVTIPDGVKSIGSYSFTSCSGITNLTIGSGVTSISPYVFSGCSGLTSVTIPDGVTSIGHNAFQNCSGLTSVTMPYGVTSIGQRAFDGCSDALFDTTTIPGVKLVGGWAVGYTSSLSGPLDLTGVRGIGESAFSYCSGLTSVTIPGGVARIGDFVFSGCSGMTNVTIPNSVTSIGDSAFSGCSGLTSVTMPNSVTSIGFHAFQNCSGLTSVMIPDSVTSIGDGAFSGCSGLTSVTIGNGVTNIAYQAFYGCTALAVVKCHPDAAGLTWGNARYEVKADGSTVIHVKASQLAAYQAKFSNVKAVFIGDLPDTITVTIGSGDTMDSCLPTTSFYNYSISHQIYTSEEIGTAGAIGSIAFKNGGIAKTRTLEIYLVHTDKSSFDGASDWINVSDADKVFSGSVTFIPGGWTEIPLDTSFDYNGMDNLAVIVDDNTEGYSTGLSCYVFAAPGMALSAYSDNTNFDPLSPGGYDGTVKDVKNQIQMKMDPSGSPAPVTPDVSITAGEYFKATLAELGYNVPTDGKTAYNVVAYGLPAGLKLKSNAAVTKKNGKKTVVVKPAKTEWWLEGVPTAGLDYATTPPYIVITTNGVAQTLPLSLGVEAQDVTPLGDLALGQTLNDQFYLPGVTNGWTVTGLPTGLKYTAKLLTTTKKKGKKVISVTTNALPYSVYGKTTKAGLFTVTAKKKVGAYNETMKYRVLVKPAKADTAIFSGLPTSITTMAYVPFEWNLTNGTLATGMHLPVMPAMAKVAGLPKGLAFAAATTYKDKKKKQVKQAGQTVVGTPSKPGTYVVTFTRNVKEKVKGKTKTVAKTAQILWVVKPNDAKLSLGFNTAGGVVEGGVVGLKYTDMMAFNATSNATVTASGLPSGIKLAKLDDSGSYAFTGFTAKAGTYLVTVKATLNGNTVAQRVVLKVDGLPAWAKGTYNGYVAGEDGATNGLATVTVSAAGKVSGKFYDRGTNWTFTAASYNAAVPGAEFICSNVVAKYAYKVKERVKVKGKWTTKNVTKYVTRSFTLRVGQDALGGTAMLEEAGGDTAASAWQNLWGSTYKALGKKLFSSKSGKKTLAYRTFAIKSTDPAGVAMGLLPTETLSLKVTTAGAVTATMSFDTGKKSKSKVVIYKASCSTAVIPLTEATAEEFEGEAYLYFAPSPNSNFPGFVGAAPF